MSITLADNYQEDYFEQVLLYDCENSGTLLNKLQN